MAMLISLVFLTRASAGAELFQPPAVYDSGGASAGSVATVDLNADHAPDLVVANVFSSSVGVLLNNGDGTFHAAVVYVPGGLYVQAVASADVDGDGHADVIAAIRCVNAADCSGQAAVMLGNGDGTLQPATMYPSGGEVAWNVATADVNNDRRTDVLVVNELSDTVGILLGIGDGSFQPALTFYSGDRSPRAVAVGDVNGDALPDLAVANRCAMLAPGCSSTGTLGVLLGNGDGTFQPAVNYASGGDGPISVTFADLDGDHAPDLVVANACSLTDCSHGVLSVLMNNGNGTFGDAASYDSAGLGTRAVVAADVNGDGRLDLLAASLCPSGGCSEGALSALIARPDATFAPAIVFPTGAYGGQSVSAADLNRDGATDVVVGNEGCPDSVCTNGTVAVLLNNNALIRVSVDIQPRRFPNRFNPDSHATIEVAVFGSASWDATAIDIMSVRFGPLNARARHVRVEDVNRDGFLDLIFSFKTNEAGIACGDLSGALDGVSRDGRRFRGEDTVELLGCGKTSK
jgi:hypothetical protein